METKETGGELIQLELKYCERCGGLFLRRQNFGETFCLRCAGQMAKGYAIKRPARVIRMTPPVNPNGLYVVANGTTGRGGTR